MKIQSIHLRHFVGYAELRGMSPADRAQLNKLWSVESREVSESVPVEQFYEILDVVIRSVEDPLLGIKAANLLTLKLLGLIYQISLQATTVGEALHYLQSYMSATMPVVDVDMTATEDSATITMSVQSGSLVTDRVILENVLTIIAREITLMSVEMPLIRLYSPYADADYPANWFRAEVFGIEVKSVNLRANLKGRAGQCLEVLIPEYIGMLTKLEPGTGMKEKVGVVLLSLSDPALPGIEAVSDALAMTPRTLQRRLSDENITFREITENLKKEICSLLLRHEPYTITTMAGILGFSEPAAFIRSFRKWYGDSPKRMRKSFRLVRVNNRI